MELAAKLNLAQPFLENVTDRLLPLIVGVEGCAIQYFVVRDRQVKYHGRDKYLLDICSRNQMLFFCAKNPITSQPAEFLKVIKTYSNGCKKLHTTTDSI